MNEPKIRFKGFQGEWEETSLGKLSTNYKYGINAAAIPYDGTNKYLRITDIDENTRMFSQEDLTSPGTDLSCCNEYLLEEGDITIARTGASVGKSYIYHLSDGKVYFAGFLIRTRLNENVDKDYVFYSTLTDKYAKYIRLVSQRSGQPGVNVEELKGYTFNLPCDKAEQCNIASYFQHLDALIQSTTKKIESLKQVKAASLQSMFPQEGETTPRVRFKGFEGEWSICPLKYFAKKSTEKNISMDYTITLTNSAEYGVINQRDFFDHDISNDDHINGYYIIHHDDFVYNPRVSTAAPVGPINRNLLGYSGVMSPLYLIFRVNGINKDYLSYYFKTTLWHNYMKLEGNTGARFDRLAISDEQFFNMPICVPRDEKEQTVIASYFTTLDRQITLQTQCLEKLKQIKAACLDNMFV